MDQMKYLRALRARWIWIIGATVVLAVLGGVIPVPKTTDVQTNSLADAVKSSHGHYTATAVLGLPPNASTDATARLTALGFYAQSSAVQQGIITRLAFTGDPKVLAKAITIVQPTAQTNTGSVQVIGKGGTAVQAAAVANSYGDSLSAYLASLSSQNTATTLAAAQKQVTNLQNQINAIGSQISAIVGSKGTTEAVISANPQLVTLVAQRNALQASYTAAFQTLSQAQTANTTAPAIVALQRADAATAVHVGPHLSIVDRRWVRILIGLLIGFVLSALFVLLRAFFDRRLSSRAAVELACEAPVLAEIARFSVSGGMQDVAVVSAPQSRTAEAYRLLRTVIVAWAGLGHTPEGSVLSAHRVGEEAGRGGALAILAGGRGSHEGVLLPRDSGHPWRLVVLGSVCGEKSHSTVVANIAAAIAETGRTVLVVRTSGGREAFSGGGRDHGALVVHPTGVEGVRTIDLHSAGHDKQDPAEVLSALGGHADLLLVDAGPALTAHDVVSFGALSQGIVITAQFHWTPQEEAERCGQLLRRAGVPFRGIVLTDVPRKELLGSGGTSSGILPLDVRPSGVERLNFFDHGDSEDGAEPAAAASYVTTTPASPLTTLRGRGTDQPATESRSATPASTAASDGVDAHVAAMNATDVSGISSNGGAPQAGALNGASHYSVPDSVAFDEPVSDAAPAGIAPDEIAPDEIAPEEIAPADAGQPAAPRSSAGRSPLDRTRRSPLDQESTDTDTDTDPDPDTDPLGLGVGSAQTAGSGVADATSIDAAPLGAASVDTDLLGTDPLSAEHRAARRFGRSPLDAQPTNKQVVVSDDSIDLTAPAANSPRRERSFGGRRRRSPLDDDRHSS